MAMLNWSENTWLMIVMISIIFNFALIIITFLTGVGREALTRFKNKFRFKSGRYANTLYINKSGNMMEVFRKIDKTGRFDINDKDYVRNPMLQFPYKGIPTMIHLEDFPEPLNPFKDKEAAELSTAELDTVMMSVSNFDLQQWITSFMAKYDIPIAIGVLVIVAAFAAMAYFGYINYEMLRDGTFSTAAIECASGLTKTVV